MLTGPGGTVQIQPLPPPEPDPVRRFANKLYDRVVNWLPRRSGLPRWNESTGPEALYQDVRAALGGTIVREVRGTEHRSEEHTSELQSLMRISYAVLCLKK